VSKADTPVSPVVPKRASSAAVAQLAEKSGRKHFDIIMLPTRAEQRRQCGTGHCNIRAPTAFVLLAGANPAFTWLLSRINRFAKVDRTKN
jgi:hypothetical protein